MPASRAAAWMVSGSSSSWPEKWRMRRRRSSGRSASGACRRAATTARHAGIVAAMRGRTEVSIGIPWSPAIEAKACACFAGVKALLEVLVGAAGQADERQLPLQPVA
jgi:hypothetical protein